jgi:hypothetical protein
MENIMIKQTDRVKTKNKNAEFYVSTSNGHKIIGTSVLKSDSNSTTISRRPVIEVDPGIIPDPADLNSARDALIAQARQGNLTQVEIETLIEMIFRYKARHYKPGQFFYDELSETVYEVKQEHQGSAEIIPASRPDLYEPLISLAELA